MIRFVDNLLNGVTMYRLILYYTGGLLVVAALFGAIGWMPYSPISVIVSTLFILTVSLFVNSIFESAFNAPTNTESTTISALILALIITPPTSYTDGSFWWLAFWAATWAIASKYLFTIGKKHVFNPAAFGVALTAVFLNLSATWWIGTSVMLPFVLLGGLLIVRKIRRWDLVLSFFAVSIPVIVLTHTTSTETFFSALSHALLTAPLAFFAFVMLTEPLTTPPTRWLRVAYGAFTGLMFAPFMHIGSVYFTPELALLVGNILSFVLSPRNRMVLSLREVREVGTDVYDYIFAADRVPHFRPGQYAEWALPHVSPDNRGNRRYLTIASSPTESLVRMGVKFYPRPSSFKQGLAHMRVGDTIVASHIGGDFTMPRDKRKKLVFIAGGIGITPFRSMVKYLLDSNEPRDIVFFYAVRTPKDVAYREVLEEAQKKMGMKVIYVASEPASVTPDWKGRVGTVDAKLILQEVPDAGERTFYISGPQKMVSGIADALHGAGISRSQIKRDYFPGF